MTVAQILARHRHVLLDFDGPVCAVFGGELPAAEVARRLADVARLRGVQLPAHGTDDPFDVLHAAAETSPDDGASIEQALRDAEVRAVATAPMTRGARDALRALRSTGHTVTIVSNNSAAAVHAFLHAHDLDAVVEQVVGRSDPDPNLLKPHPHLVTLAINKLSAPPGECVLIGDSTTDITAARAAGTAAIAYASKPGKAHALAAHAPDAIIGAMAELITTAEQPSDL